MSKHLYPDMNSRPYIGNCYPPPSAQPGEVWFDSSSQSIQVFDGYNWIGLPSPEPSLSWEAEQAIDRLIEMISNQDKISELAAKYPLVEEALGQLEVALKLTENLDGE